MKSDEHDAAPSPGRTPVTLEGLVRVALAIVEQEGASSLGINRLARALRIKPPSLYNHVTDAADLRRRVAIASWRVFAESCRESVGRRHGASALRAICNAYRSFSRAHRGLFELMETVPLSPEDRDYEECARMLLSVFAAPLHDLAVPPGERMHAIRGLRAAVHGFVLLERNGQFAMADEIEASFQRLLALLISALEQPAVGAPAAHLGERARRPAARPKARLAPAAERR